MATRIPLPTNDRSGLFEGLMAGHRTRQGNEQLRQHAELLPFQKRILEAQANEAQMWANILGYGQQQPQMQGGEQMPTQMMQPGMDMRSPVQMPQETGGVMNIDMPYAKPMQPRVEQPQTQERILKPGNEALYGMDRFAGMRGIPPVQQHTDPNGNIVTRYPSGKITSMPAEDVEAKAERETRVKGEQEKQGLRIKEAEELESTIPEAIHMRDKAQQLLDLMEDPEVKQNAPDWWGVSPFGTENAMKLRKHGVKSEKFGQMETIMAELVGSFAQEISPGKTLATALGIAQNAKPTFLEEYEPSKGKVKQMLKSLNRYVDTKEDRYKDITGRKIRSNVESSQESQESAPGNMQQRLAKERETSEFGGSNAMIIYDVPGRGEAHVPANMAPGFLKKYPNAKVKK